ncbi:MAG: DNA-deoxyinosine glycosylase [Mariprofundaceae bacterium]
MRAEGFPPIVGKQPRVLILGTMPSPASLAAGQYYAHPRNAFWPIMGALLDFDPALPYPARCERLREAGVALWDVAHRCVRPGSQDAAIREVEPNDFHGFFNRCPCIRTIFFNGAKAAALFRRLALPVLPESARAIPRTRLPSTSPAHATLDFAAKLEAWRAVREALT